MCCTVVHRVGPDRGDQRPGLDAGAGRHHGNNLLCSHCTLMLCCPGEHRLPGRGPPRTGRGLEQTHCRQVGTTNNITSPNFPLAGLPRCPSLLNSRWTECPAPRPGSTSAGPATGWASRSTGRSNCSLHVSHEKLYDGIAIKLRCLGDGVMVM